MFSALAWSAGPLAATGVPRLDDGVERAALVGGIALHGLDEIGDEVMPLFG
jgi:hypothetical protein